MPRKKSGSPSKADPRTHLPQDAETKAPSVTQEGSRSSRDGYSFTDHDRLYPSSPRFLKDTSTPNDATKRSPKPPLTTSDQAGTEHMYFRRWRQWRHTSAWSCSPVVICTTMIASTILLIIIHAFLTRQLDPKGCDMCWSRPMYIKFNDFDTEHTRFASKYSLYTIKEGGVDENEKVKGVPVLFIPGNAGSFKQARCLESESAHYFNTLSQKDPEKLKNGVASLDFFTVDFNEDFSAFHGQTLLDQAEYVNDAIAYILSLYHDPKRAQRDPTYPDPSSVILIGHSMGGVVARAMVTLPNYQLYSINTIITMSAPHARAPVSVDKDLVQVYQKINDYWRRAHLQLWANDNPLWHVTLVSIAGGGLDTVVPSDFASLESLVPMTHGFTVFTSGIPNVWTGSDHIQTTWCVQLMKAITHSVFEVLDVHRASQTKPRAERMRIFKQWLLTGMEDVIEKSLPQQEASVLIALESESNTVLRSDDRLVLRNLGDEQKSKAYLFPIPLNGRLGDLTFTVLSDQSVQHETGHLDVLFCSPYSPQTGHSISLLSMNSDLSGDVPGSARLACKSAAKDSIKLPASTRRSSHPFDKEEPFTYMQFDYSDFATYRFIAVIDKALEPRKGWAMAEFSERSKSTTTTAVGLRRLLSSGFRLELPSERPIQTDINVLAMHSSLLAFHLWLGPQRCEAESELFTPLLRQHIDEPFESKYFVNIKAANISLHGIAPFMPPPLRAASTNKGVSLQFWTDPTCNASVSVNLKVDLIGSTGKLVMRYRLVLAAFPLLIMALILRKQFTIFDDTGTFITFFEAADCCLRSSLPLLILGLSVAAASIPSWNAPTSATEMLGPRSNATESPIDFTKNDLLLGSQDSVFWFLVPLFGLISVGICVMVNYATLCITQVFYFLYDFIRARPSWTRMEDISGRSIAPGFSPSSPRRRLVTTSVLLFAIATFIPYQFAFIDALFMQLITCVRALRVLKFSESKIHHNFYNYTHSVLLLMIWILPINLPVLAVWAHNLKVHWLTPFTSHHNIISVMPYLVLVETLTSGRMIPRLTGSLWRYLTNVLFFSLAVCAAVYGVSYAYMLHQIGNAICAWLVAVHLWGSGGVDLKGMKVMLEGSEDDEQDVKKQP